jgi:hypothetical protein
VCVLRGWVDVNVYVCVCMSTYFVYMRMCTIATYVGVLVFP